MGAVFQFLPGHDFFGHRQQFLFVVDPACLDGGFAGYGVQQLVPDGIFALPASVQQIGGQGFQGVGCRLGA